MLDSSLYDRIVAITVYLPVGGPGRRRDRVGTGQRATPHSGGANYERFATEAPRRIDATVSGCGHADVLTGRALRWGRMLCPGGPDPQRARATVTALIAAHLRGELQPHLVAAGPGMGTPSLGRDDQWPTTVVWN